MGADEEKNNGRGSKWCSQLWWRIFNYLILWIRFLPRRQDRPANLSHWQHICPRVGSVFICSLSHPSAVSIKEDLVPSWFCDEVGAVVCVQKFLWPSPWSREHPPVSIPALEECLSSQALSSPALLPESVIPAGHTKRDVSPFFA